MKTFPKQMTIGEMYDPAMEITDQQEADEYFEACVQRGVTFFGQTLEEATRIQRGNLGYYAGYCDTETMQRINRLFKTTHPIFGDTQPTAEEAVEAGKRLATNFVESE